MTLPPGRARLATNPAATGSPAFVITIGIVVVAFFAANAGGVAATTIRSTLRRTKSAASSGRGSDFCSPNRYSMAIFFPSIQPSLLSSCRNASKRTALPEAVLPSRKPMRGTFPVCCASTAEHGARSREHRAKNVTAKMLCARRTVSNDISKNCFLISSPVCFSGSLPLAPCYFMTLSALTSTFGGIVRPICFAVFRLITSSNFVGCSTGRSEGLAPFRILST